MVENSSIDNGGILDQIERMDLCLPQSPLTRKPAIDENLNPDPFGVWCLEEIDNITDFIATQEGLNNIELREERFIRKPEKWQALESMVIEFHNKHRPRGKSISKIIMPEETGITTGFTRNGGSILTYSAETDHSFNLNYRIHTTFDQNGQKIEVVNIIIDKYSEIINIKGSGIRNSQPHNTFESSSRTNRIRILSNDKKDDRYNLFRVTAIANRGANILSAIEDSINP